MNPRVFLDFAIDGTPIGRVIAELYADSVPKTAENFRSLCTGERGLSPKTQAPLYYKNSIIHRSIPNFMIQGGGIDFTKRNGLGGESIYGAPFPDEDLSRPVDAEGLIVMANRGPNTNGSQFFITLQPCPHLNGKHVVFGRVIRGYDDVLKRITEVPTDERDRPERPVVIINCGELERRKANPPPKQEREDQQADIVSSGEDRSEDDRGRKEHKYKRKRYNSSQSKSPDRSEKTREVRRRHNGSPKSSGTKPKSKPNRTDKDKKRKHEDTSTSSLPITRKETEEEYDARLEREENERLQALRRTELAKLQEQLVRENKHEEKERRNAKAGTINYKGRGRMKYIDPETL